MKRDPMDWNIEAVDLYIARMYGYTLDQVMSLDFPKPDYIGGSGALYWADDTVVAWLDRFNTAIHTMARAADPAGFERFLQMLRDLMHKGDKNAG